MKGNYDYSSDSDDNYEKSGKNYDLTKLKNVNLDYNLKVNSSNKIHGEIKNIDREDYNRSLRIKDRSDRATVEQVIDARISKILYKLINKGEITEINGCISTGKEANVYYAKGVNGKELALKIYKTSILIFKDRDRYISGEFRFRHGYCKGNPRKMVALWAEKEVRNLKRLQIAGIKSPTPLILKSNLIVMDFIGHNSVNAPRLKDAEVDSTEEWENLYISILNILRKLFKECKLVHADFSEYNLLYYEKEIYVIDVGQAVEDFHPNAIIFLKRDCHNVNSYFNKNGVDVITDQQLFDLVSGFEIKENIGEILGKLREENLEKEKINNKFKEIENGLFVNFEIPRSFQDEDVDKITGNYEIEEALSKLCGVVKKEQEKDLIIPKRDEKGKIIVSNKDKDNNKKIGKDKNKIKEKEEKNKNEKCDINFNEIKIDEGNISNKQNNQETDEKVKGEEVDDDDDEEEGEYESENYEEDDYDDEEDLNKEIKDKEEGEIDAEGKKKSKFDPFEGLSKQERKKKVKEGNREKRATKKMTKYEKNKAIKKSSGKR